MHWDVLGYGLVSVDDLLYVPHYPPPNVKVQVLRRERQGGGLTGTALVAAARLGVRCAFAGVLGDDELSRHAISELEREGVDCTLLMRRADARPCHSTIVVDQSTGSRNIFYTRDGVMARPIAQITPELVAQCRVLFVDSLDLDAALQGTLIADALGVPVVADLDFGEYDRADALLSHVSHLILPEDFALRLTGVRTAPEAVAALARTQRPCTAVTAGERGAWYAVAGGPVQHQPAFAVPTVDTTGCGDVFHGAYAACVARELSVPESIRFASATAAIKAMYPGGRAGIPNWAGVEQFLAANAAETQKGRTS